MTANTFGIMAAWSYGVALAGYAVFAARIALGWRGGPRARLLLTALIATAAWAGLSLLVGLLPTAGVFLAASVADALRYAAWFAFLASLLRETPVVGGAAGASRDKAALPNPASVLIGAGIVIGVVLLAGVLLSDGTPLAGAPWFPGPRAGYLVRLCVAVFGLVLIEHVVRRVLPLTRWGIRPLAIAVAGVFALDLYLYADALLFGRLDPLIWVSRGLANAIVIPFIAIATARNTGWTVDLHLSRRVVFHSSALLVSGAFLLAVAVAGYFVRYFGGEWGRAFQIELLFAAVLFGLLVATSGRFRSRLKVFVSKHFFSYRYDYREEWLRFTRALSAGGTPQSIQERTVAALADLVESPGGALWLKDGARGYVPAARWNVPAIAASEPPQGALAAFMARMGWVVDVAELREHPERYDGVVLPEWLAALASAWIVVPLFAGTELMGWVALTTPRTPIDLDWEVRDLLKTASSQAASYLGQMRAAEALLEARKFEAFNRMSAFVVHDLKNLVAQLTLMLSNSQRHRDNPAFQADMLGTVEHVVGRMNALMLQLRVGATPVETARPVNLEALVRRVCAAKTDPQTVIEHEFAPGVTAIGHEDRLEHVIGHLVQNAIDATSPPRQITLRLASEGNDAVLAVVDQGVGMTEQFIRERLFKPFQTTKSAGMGIGVYESSQYVNGLGGRIAVESAPGRGTRVSLHLPLAPGATASPGVPVGEAAA